MAETVYLASLGCAKNLVNSEQMLALIRADGMEIALRTMSPSIIAVDEIGARRESDAMVESLNSGIKIIATAHARDRCELEKRGGLAPFLKAGAFDVFFGIFHTDAGYSCKIEDLVC